MRPNVVFEKHVSVLLRLLYKAVSLVQLESCLIWKTFTPNTEYDAQAKILRALINYVKDETENG